MSRPLIIDLVVYHFAAFGLAYIIGHSKISLPIRKLIDPRRITGALSVFRAWTLALIECPACVGFWIGIGAELLLLTPWEASTLLWGLSTCAVNLLLAEWAGLSK